MEEPKRHPSNADGDFFVEYDMCMACDAPCSEAPELMAYDENMHCYFKRQPENLEEIAHAINAVRVCCIEAVRYEGNDSQVLQLMRTLPWSSRIEDSPTFLQRLIDRFLKCFR